MASLDFGDVAALKTRRIEFVLTRLAFPVGPRERFRLIGTPRVISSCMFMVQGSSMAPNHDESVMEQVDTLLIVGNKQ